MIPEWSAVNGKVLKHSGWEIEFDEMLVTAAEVEEEVGVRIELPLLRVARMIGVVTK